MQNRPTKEEHDRHRLLHYHGSGLSDVILGGQDGLVNVLGVILGLAAAGADTRLIVAAGLAAAFAESISMGAVAYTSAQANRDYYQAEQERERRHIREFAEIERDEVRRIAGDMGVEGDLAEALVDRVTSDERRWIDVMMAQEFRLSPINEGAVTKRALLVATSAIAGSLVPLLPFFALSVTIGMAVSLGVSGLTLFAIGAYKTRVMGIGQWHRSGLEMAAIGVVAALAGYLIGWFFQAPAG